MERTLVIIKPDGIKRKLIGSIIQRIEEKGYIIENMIMKELTEEDLVQHYYEHREKSFFSDLVEYMSEGKSLILIIRGENCIQGIRRLMGATEPLEAEQGSIRGMYATNKTRNLIHGSDSNESAAKEIDFFFPDK